MPGLRTPSRRWDLFCRVIDNYGDAGVSWRLAADLGARGERVRLWIDDPAPLAFMAPRGAPGVEVVHWTAEVVPAEPGDIVIEAFGCDPPPDFVERMAARTPPPLWLNLEYLSAEAWVERSHGLPSPQRNGLTKWFFFPGFGDRTGGLLREHGLLAERARFDRGAWLAAQGIAPRPGERIATLFCYDHPRIGDFAAALADAPTLLLATPGHAQRLLAGLRLPPAVRVHALPWFDQPGYDRLLWSADLNVVRGEDSVVRALWAGAPFVWHIYPQHDDAHAAKLQAFLALLTAGAEGPAACALAALWRRFNGLESGPLELPPAKAWLSTTQALRARLAAQDDLVTRLLAFTAGKT